MTDQTKNSERFDAYLFNEMSESDRLQFEKELASDSDLMDEFQQHKNFLKDFKTGVEYREIKKDLKSIHESIYNPGKNFFLSRQFLIPLGIAASFVLIILAINPFVKSGNMASDQGDYQELDKNSESSDTIVYYQDEYVSSAIDDQSETEPMPGPDAGLLSLVKSAPVGTAFMISSDGYFLTSKHLVENYKIIRLQQKEEKLAFEVEVIYVDSLKDFAILKCHPTISENFKPVPFRFLKGDIELGGDVFTLGYPKTEIVYTKGVISSQKGYLSDSLSFEISMPCNPGYSGAPLFTYSGDLVGIITANNNRQQSVTYVLDYHYIQNIMNDLKKKDVVIDMSKNFTKRAKDHAKLVERYRPFVFEVHP